MARRWREMDLKNVAYSISKVITIRSYVNGCSRDTLRITTLEESKIINNIISGALLSLNDIMSSQYSKTFIDGAIQAIADSSEHIVDLFIPNCNGYDTIYLTLLDVVDEWDDIYKIYKKYEDLAEGLRKKKF